MKLRRFTIAVTAVTASMLFLAGSVSSSSSGISGADFEDGSLSSWEIGSQTGSLTNGTISGGGTGVTLISGAVTFNSGSHGAVGSPTLGDGSPNPYYQPAVDPATWSFSPYGSYGVALQPNGNQQFAEALTALGVSSADQADLLSELSSQASASGYGSGTPTDASWIKKVVTLEAGTTYTMSWNYIGTDYVPFNDGSITSLTPISASDATISVNNSGSQFALLGFTNPGTGDYSTGTFGSTGWQISTYSVSVSGDYLLGFAVFNLDDTALSPVLLVDSQPGSTQKNGEDFGAVAPNNPDAPTVPPTVTEPPATDPPATDPPTTDAPVTDPPATDPPTTDAPVDTDPPGTDAPVETDPPVTDAPVETDPPVTEPPVTDPPVEETRPRPARTTTTTSTTPTTTIVESTTVPPSSVVDVTTPVIPPSGELPKTGSGSGQVATFAILAILIGVLVLRLGKELRND